MNEQPEALRLAELLSTHYNIYVDTVEAAAELRRLHAENEQLRVSRQASAPDGWKLVPVEPTRGMLDAAHKDLVRDAEIDLMLKGIHSAMLAAAPKPPVVEQPQG